MPSPEVWNWLLDTLALLVRLLLVLSVFTAVALASEQRNRQRNRRACGERVRADTDPSPLQNSRK